MSEGVIVALISAQALLVATVLPLLFSTRKYAKKTSADAAETRYHVSNDHTANLREENDERHAEVMRLLRSHGRTLGKHGRQMRRIEQRVGLVEDTIPKPRTTRGKKQ